MVDPDNHIPEELLLMKAVKFLLTTAILLALAALAFGQAQKTEQGFKTIFDGKTFN
jgi:hypothetical protein